MLGERMVSAGSSGSFLDNGSYLINTANTPEAYITQLFNDEYVVGLSQRMKGSSFRVDRYNQISVFEHDRSFYLSEENGAHRLFQGEGHNHQVEFHPGYVIGKEDFEDFGVEMKAFVPVTGKREFWKICVTNTDKVSKQLNLFCHFPISMVGPMGGECRLEKERNYVYKYSFPYHVFYEDMEKVKNNYAYTYVLSDIAPASYEGRGQVFKGCDNPLELPVAVQNGSCSNCPGEGKDLAASLHYAIELMPGESKAVTLVLGCSVKKEEIDELAAAFPSFEEELNQVEKLWEARCSAYHIETPYREVNHLFNLWFPMRATYLTRLNRGSAYCPIRNQLQDALGYSMVEPEEALKYALEVLRRQKHNGYIKQWNMVDGSPAQKLCKIEHSDGPIWLILCITEIIQNTGKLEHFLQLEPYSDCDVKESVLEHLRKAALYMDTMVGAHGLCLFLDGDWTDPINGAGRKGKGESVWNSMALIYAIKQLTAIFPDEELTAIANRHAENINKYCWDGKWYIAGFDDDGIPFGKSTDKEARIFLNTQSWAFIAGIVPEENKAILNESIETLRTPFGYLLLAPALTAWNPVWGRVSLKQKGTGENGSVYCHASMFKALGDCMQGNKAEAFRTLFDTLPINGANSPDKNHQLPLFVPNSYFGIEGPNFGKSTRSSGTGTNAWMIWVMLKHILGVQTTVSGISFQNNLPECLQGTKVTVKYRDELYHYQGSAE